MTECLLDYVTRRHISYSENFEGQVRDLEAVLERLRQAIILLRADKCHFAYKEVNFLGHRISEEGRRP